MQTTRRFDALKLFISLQALGRKQLADMIDTTINLAEATASLIAAEPRLELATYPTINAVVFRYCPATPSERQPEAWANQINSQIRMTLLQTGEAILAQTRIGNLTYLKFTLLNPCTKLADIATILIAVKRLGKKLETTQ